MYKLVRRYFGELCDKEQTDKEVYDEEICFEHKNFAFVENQYKQYLQKDKQNGYVLDEEIEKNASLGEFIRLFFDYQENWNNYIEMFIIKKDDEKNNLSEELNNLADNFDLLTNKEIREVLLELEEKYTVHYQKLKNSLAERVIKKRIIEFKGSRTINNNTFISFIRDLEKEFECEIDLIDLSVRFIFE